MASRHHKFAVFGQLLHLAPPVGTDAGVGVDGGWKVVAKWVGRGRLKRGIRLFKVDAVDCDAAIFDPDVIAGNAHHALYEQGRIRMVKNDNVAAANVTIRHEQTAEAAGRAGWSENLLVD